MKFQISKTYSTRSICDHECIVSITVVDRTAKTITTTKGKTYRTQLDDRGNEYVRPWGRYSMAPLIDATDVTA